ncbi:extracellular solute-binding protein [Cohnella faecalis]|uniref:Extracellular solute-binding protein n=1 Tax=Cohnella faecalis TaxID=2315694 RepID=A0A398D057_9BACL|nr:extracellular solute-binding protein [Cohnella faecalis]RIE04554.1 extracellular solute-binding protein [Cohnella faecalis]
MNGKQKKPWLLGALTLILAGMFAMAGCSSNNGNGNENGSASPIVTPSGSPPASPSSTPSAAPAEEPYSIKLLLPQDISKPYDPAKDAIKKAVEEKLGVTLVPEIVDVQQYKTKLNLKMSSNDIPDIVRIDFADDFQKYAPQGAFVDLTELINEKDTPNIWKEVPQQVFEQAKVNGKIYGIPYQGGPGSGYRWNLVMRSDYLKEVGESVPTTLDAYYNALKKIKEMKKDVIPLGGYTAKTGEVKFATNSFDNIFGAFGVTPGYFTQQDGKFSNYDIDPRMKEALKFLQKMYAENLIDKEFATIKEEQFRAKLFAGKLFSWMGWWSTAKDYDTQIESFELKKSGKLDKDGTLPDQSSEPYKYLSLTGSLTGADGKAVAPQGAPFGQVLAISAKTKDPKKLLAIIDKSLEIDNQMLTVWGVENVDYELTGGKLQQIPTAIDQATQTDKDGNFRGTQRYTWAPGLKGWPHYLESLPLRPSMALDTAINNPNQITDAANYLDSPTKIAKQVELNTMRDSYFTQIIMGASIDKFDEFVAKWKSQGGDQILQELEQSYQKKMGK